MEILLLLQILYFAFITTQLYALTIHFSHPPSGLVHPYSIHLLALFSYIAGQLSAIPLLFAASSPTPTSTTADLGIMLASAFLLSSVLLFTWMALTTRPGTFSVIYGRVTPQHVVDTGPFKYIRHPTYVAYALGWVGAVVYVLVAWLPDYLLHGHDLRGAWMSMPLRSVGLVGAVMVLLWLYRIGAVLEEEQFLGDEGTVGGMKTGEGVRGEYSAYVRKVKWRWIPGFM